MKIIYDWEVKNYMNEDHCSYIRNFCGCETKAWTKIRLVRDSNPWPLRYRCSDDLHSYNSTLRSSNIWFSYIYNFIIILSRVYNEPIQRPAPSWLVSLIGRGLHRYRSGQGFESCTSMNFFSGFLFATAKVAYITGMIFIHIIGTLSVRITAGTQRQQQQKR